MFCPLPNFDDDCNFFNFRALDIFAQFFIDPLMHQNSMEREREAVDSEHEGRLNNDNVRLWAVRGKLADGNHPMSKFLCGNKKSLTLEDGVSSKTGSSGFFSALTFSKSGESR